jgi:hypothetical protein
MIWKEKECRDISRTCQNNKNRGISIDSYIPLCSLLCSQQVPSSFKLCRLLLCHIENVISVGEDRTNEQYMKHRLYIMIMHAVLQSSKSVNHLE